MGGFLSGDLDTRRSEVVLGLLDFSCSLSFDLLLLLQVEIIIRSIVFLVASLNKHTCHVLCPCLSLCLYHALCLFVDVLHLDLDLEASLNEDLLTGCGF